MIGYYLTFSQVDKAWKLYQRQGLVNCCYVDTFYCTEGKQAQVKAEQQLGQPVEIH
jgi:myo-inositol-hexaphosphate 3-phosphohydrolase